MSGFLVPRMSTRQFLDFLVGDSADFLLSPPPDEALALSHFTSRQLFGKDGTALSSETSELVRVRSCHDQSSCNSVTEKDRNDVADQDIAKGQRDLKQQGSRHDVECYRHIGTSEHA